MSDPENDQEFLEEIKALEDALAIEQQHVESPKPRRCIMEEGKTSCGLPRRNNVVSSSRGFGQVEPFLDDEEEEETKPSPVDGWSAYRTNIQLIETLRETKHELLFILERCRENRAMVEEKIQAYACSKNVDYVPLCAAAMPYFKDARDYPAPLNNDAKKKRKNEELNLNSLPTPGPWTPRDRNVLWRAIRQEAAESFANSGRLGNNELRHSDKDETEPNSDVGPPLLPKNFKALVEAHGEREFDWLKIAMQYFEGRHSADECRVMWQVFLHPDVNRYKWSKNEDARLEKAVKMYNAQNWDAIAKQLDSRRTGYQCFVRYKSIERKSHSEDDVWTPAEDRRLAAYIEKFRIGDYVPWGTVARYMPGRVKTQVYYRWIYNSAPQLKKGRFTRDEDLQLLDAVQRYGTNFTRIANGIISNRSSVQLGNRYKTLMMRERGTRNTWSISEDARLLVLYNEHGSDWSSIARAMDGKTRTQVRHRHKAITRYWAKGVSLYEIPRSGARNDPRSLGNAAEDEVELAALRVKENSDANALTESGILKKKKCNKEVTEMEKIDLELIEYFQHLPASTGTTTPGRKRKYYGSEELEEIARKLHLLLKTFEADLDIPEELDDPRLTEKDKQLLETVRKRQILDTRRAVIPNSVRRYCDENPRPAEQIHFVCTGDCHYKPKKLLFHDNIDYQSPPDLDHCRIVLNTGQFSTSEEIVKLIGEDMDDEFEKISRLLTGCTRELRVVERVYVLGPEMCSKLMSKIEVMPQSETSIEINGILQTSSGGQSNTHSARTKKRDKADGHPGIVSGCDGIIQCLDQSMNCLEPNYHTLLALHRILANKSKTRPDQRQTSSPMSQAAKKSMEKLKKRLIQLFKYPIGLSNIFRTDADGTTNLERFQASDSNNVPSDNARPSTLLVEKKCAGFKQL